MSGLPPIPVTAGLPPKPPITSTYIASGTEGCITSPALPNLSENGSRWEEYPDYVTKLFKNSEQFDKALTNSQKITALLHNNSHAVYPYRYKDYKGTNIKTSIPGRGKSTIELCELDPSDSLLPLRMKNLGVSIADLTINKGGSLDKAKTIPFVTILDNINRVYRQIRTLFKNGYIHGDVRQTNIMLNPNTGKITLIDFGWLYPINEFFENYMDALGFYSNPPESLLYCFMEDKKYRPMFRYLSWLVDSKTTEESIRSMIPNHFTEGKSLPVRKSITSYLNFSRAAKNTIDIADLQAALINAALYFKSEIAVAVPRNYGDEFKQYYTLMAPSFDLYGLSFTIHMLIQSVYASLDTITKGGAPYSGEETTLIRRTIEELVRDVIRPGMDMDITKRISIIEACKRLEYIVNSYHDMSLSLRGGRRRKTHKRSQNKHKRTLRRK